MLTLPPSYKMPMLVKINATAEYKAWVASLRDQVAATKISRRIDRLAEGNMGDVKPIGGGLSELRIHHGPGYRVYFYQSGDFFVLLLCGGDKSSQKSDIEHAKSLAARAKDRRK